MDVVFGWLFVSTFLAELIQIEARIGIAVGTFVILRKHPQMRQCAFKVLQEHEYVGAKISDLTGVCTGLLHSWGRNLTIESGYGYVKNVQKRIIFEQPLVIPNEQTPITLPVPGILSTGAKMDIHVTWMKIDNDRVILDIGLTQDARASAPYCLIRITDEYLMIDVYDDNNPDFVWFRRVKTPKQFSTRDQWKISFVNQGNNTLSMRVDEEEVYNHKLPAIRLNNVILASLMVLKLDTSETPKPYIVSFEFTEA